MTSRFHFCKLVIPWLLGLWMAPWAWSDARVVLHEIMYHPLSDLDAEEYVEIRNVGNQAQDLTGWTLRGGVDFDFPSHVLAPDGYLVVAADPTVFQSVHPGAGPVVGPFTGILGNSGNTVRLVDAFTNEVEVVRYSDEGDWAERVQGPLDHNHRGWTWETPADGGGSSLERMQPSLPANVGGNWRPSATLGGTPGAANTAARADAAPILADVTHAPAVPAPGREVFVTARVLDESPTGLVVRVFWRVDGAGSYQPTPMFDDGRHNDGAAGDRVFGATLPGQAERTVVEWYVRASDPAGQSGFWPAPVAGFGQVCNAMHIHLTPAAEDPGAPDFHLVMRAAERAELDALGNVSYDAQSDAEFNATFLARTVEGWTIRHRCGVRNRGNGSRTYNPNNRRINFPRDHLWEDRESLNLNARNVNSQIAGAYLSSLAGLPAERGQLVRLWENGVNYARAGNRMWGYYAWLEPVDEVWAERHFPNNAGGNVYSAQRAVSGGAVTDLAYLGTNSLSYVNAGYTKQTNEREGDWSDLVSLTYALRSSQSDSAFWAAIQPWVDVEEWIRYFAYLNLIGYDETALGTGSADDYTLYSGPYDRRFRVLAHDHDADFGINNSDQWTATTISNLASQSIFRAASLAVPGKFLRHPSVAPRYYEVLLEYLNGFFHEENLPAHLNDALGGRIPSAVLDTMSGFAAQRRASLAAQIPLDLTAVSTLPLFNGYPYTTLSSASVTGRAHAVQTRLVRVNGSTATWTPAGAYWSRTGVPLIRGLNRVLVESLDASGQVFDTATLDIWRAAVVTSAVPAVVSGNLTLAAASSPYRITNTVVNAGAVLTIQAGTTVLFTPGARLTVQGTLTANGTASSRIRLMAVPGSSGDWNGVELTGTGGTTNLLRNVDFMDAGGGDQALTVTGSRVFLDACTFSGSDRRAVQLTNASSWIRGCVFAPVSGTNNAEIIRGEGILAGGRARIEGNRFPACAGSNDILDFTGGTRPGPILEVWDNRFEGGADDGIELHAADAHIEGNSFAGFQKAHAFADTANAVSSAGATTVVLARNTFRDCDHALLLLDGSSADFAHNTVHAASVAAVHFDEAAAPAPGEGITVEGSVFFDNAAVFADTHTNHPTKGTTRQVADRSLLPTALVGLGLDNSDADPLFLDASAGDYTLRPGSPAAGTGRLGLDRGAWVDNQVRVTQPAPVNTATSLTFEVYGPGLTDYRWRVNGSAWSADTPLAAPIALTGIADGCHQLDVLARDSAGIWQAAETSVYWCKDAWPAEVRLNEVLAWNEFAHPVGGFAPDAIELHNPGDAPMDLGGYSLSDDPATPRAFVFPAGTSLPAGGFVTVYADGQTNEPGWHASFYLDNDGDSVFLFDAGTNPVDEVRFGLQIPDHSLGRDDRQNWVLGIPTLGAANQAVNVTDASPARINEVLANANSLYPDFVELWNPAPLPLSLGGAMLSDLPGHWPDRHRFPSYSYLAPGAGRVFWADGSAAGGHLDFALDALRGEVGLFDSATNRIDLLAYGPQAEGVSLGRQPDATGAFAPLRPPTPGLANPLAAGVPVLSVTTNALLPFAFSWAHQTNGLAVAEGWTDPLFNDGSWPRKPAMFYDETGALPLPKATRVPTGLATYYFRTQFTVNVPLAAASFRLRHCVDDGCAVYINGVEAVAARHAMPEPPWSHNTVSTATSGDGVLRGPFTLPSSLFVPGANTVAVEVHNNSFYSDMAFALEITAVTTNHAPGVVLHEISAADARDWVELFNPGNAEFDPAGYSLSDDPLNPAKYVFPSGLAIPAGGMRLLGLSALAPASATNAPFGLDNDGEGLFLYRPAADGGGLQNSVTFGPQAPGCTLGRLPTFLSPFTLCEPTPFGPNRAQATASPAGLRINEWMAAPLLGDDWIEVHNPAALPVALGGLSLSDNFDKPRQHVLPALSYLGGGTNGWRKFLADGQTAKGGNHLGFKLSATGEQVGLYDADETQIHTVAFGVQASGVSQGLLPDGGANVLAFPGTPTPGAPNASADTDGDGLPDLWEIQQGLDPNLPGASQDPDGDTLTNVAEYQLGTLARQADSDGDGIPDGWELAHGGNPSYDDSLTDSDLDALAYGREHALGTNPFSPDTDGDLLTDGWEVLHHLPPLLADNLGDADGDEVNDYAEFVSGTNPEVTAEAGLAVRSGAPTLWFPTIPADVDLGYGTRQRLYDVEFSPALFPANWQFLPGYMGLLGTGQPVAIPDPGIPGPVYYRVRVRLQP